VGRRTPKRIGDGDGKPWTVERRPLGSALSQSIAATEQEGNTIGFGLRIQPYIQN